MDVSKLQEKANKGEKEDSVNSEAKKLASKVEKLANKIKQCSTKRTRVQSFQFA